jgi:hypothetical protein
MNGDGMLSPFSVYLGPKKLRISSNELKRPDDTKMCAIDMSVTTLGRLPNGLRVTGRRQYLHHNQ